eukprot:768541-Hanusia_phi.AAC.5
MQNKELVSQVEMMRGENESLQHQLTELELKLKNKDEDGLSSKPSFMNKPRLSTLAKYVPAMKSGVDKAQYEQKCTELEESQAANETLKEELEDKTEELSEAQEELAKVSQQLKQLQDEFQTLKAEDDKNQAELRAMQEERARSIPQERVDVAVQSENTVDEEERNQTSGTKKDEDVSLQKAEEEAQQSMVMANSRAQRDAQELKMRRREAEHNHRLLQKAREI